MSSSHFESLVFERLLNANYLEMPIDGYFWKLKFEDGRLWLYWVTNPRLRYPFKLDASPSCQRLSFFGAPLADDRGEKRRVAVKTVGNYINGQPFVETEDIILDDQRQTVRIYLSGRNCTHRDELETSLLSYYKVSQIIGLNIQSFVYSITRS